MKRISLVILLAVFVLVSCDKETLIKDNDLPKEIPTFVSTHFPSKRIIQTVKDRDGLELTYDVVLDGNVRLEFNSKKQIIDIESGDKLPDSVIPAKIGSYVSANYPDNFIIGWEIDGKNQQVKLNNGLELEFNMAGDFLRIDL